MLHLKASVTCLICASIIILSCNKQQFYENTNAELEFSTDTVTFDTIFSTIGSATKRLMVYNPYNKILRISNIKLANTVNSPFILNIDGKQVNSTNDVEIYPKDSLYIFIQVFVNPTGSNLPLFISDSIMFTVNQNSQNIKLIAYGQDVHLIKNQSIKTQTWAADKPYLLYGDITVDSLQTLTIASGSIIYFHKQSNLLVKGTLIAQGDLTTPVIFQGDRLDQDYSDIPGQWGGIYLKPGSNHNFFDWVIIKNGTTGIQIGKFNDISKPDLQISNSIIQNMSYCSLLAFGAVMKAVNCVLADAALYSCSLTGGNYDFYHCTIANYYGEYASREFSSAALHISNYYLDSVTVVTNDLTNAGFYNSIICGNNLDELTLDNSKAKSTPFLYNFDHCLIKINTIPDTSVTSYFNKIIWNKDPLFSFKPKTYLELDTLISPAKDIGDTAIGKLYPLDLKKVNRTLDKGPDLGAYEFVEKK